MIVESLYWLTPRDEQLTQLEIINQRVVLVGHLINPIATFTVPINRVLLLGALQHRAVAGSGQLVETIEVSVTEEGMPPASAPLLLREGVSASVTNRTLTFSALPIYPLSVIRASAVFNSMTEMNQVEMSIFGLTIPRGNINIGRLIAVGGFGGG